MTAAQIHTLIIDDNPKNVSVLAQLLTLEGVAYSTLFDIANLAPTLDKLTGMRIVFLDLEFPKSNGYEALKIIKAHPNFSNVPVIAYTVHISELNEVFDIGFDGFLGKPLSAEEFPGQLAQILRGERVWYIP